MVVCLTCATCAGCAVTQKVDFAAEPNFPPTILNASAPVVEIGQTFWIDKSVTSMWSMSVRVRDDNVKQDLEAHWRLVSKDEPMPDFQRKVLTASGELIRPLPFDVQADSLHDGQCARLELVVSGSFFNRTGPAYFDATREDNDDSDLAYAFWWVWEGKGAGPPKPDYEHIAASCPTNEKLLMPAMMPTGGAAGATQ